MATEYTLQTYCEMDGVRTMRDSRVRSIYARLVAGGHDQHLFYDGQITSQEHFLRYMKHGDNAMYLVLAAGVEVGVCWLNGWKQQTARLHFSFFKEALVAGVDTVAIGRWVLRELLTVKDEFGEYLLEVLVGETPASNRLALHYLKRCGWRVVGVIPSGCNQYWHDRRENLVISSIRREDLCNDE